MNKKLFLLLIGILVVGLIVLIVFLVKRTKPNPTQQNLPTKWTCLQQNDKSYIPVRLDKDGNVQCLTSDTEGTTCSWVYPKDNNSDEDTKTQCETNIQQALAKSISTGTLTCGQDHCQKYPTDNQTACSHWCNWAKYKL